MKKTSYLIWTIIGCIVLMIGAYATTILSDSGNKFTNPVNVTSINIGTSEFTEGSAGWTETNGSLQVNGSLKVRTHMSLIGSLNITNDGITSENIKLRPNTSEYDVAIEFWKHPTSSSGNQRIAQLVAHGNATGSYEEEISLYTTNDQGTMTNRWKVLAGINSTPLIITQASGITQNKGGILHLGIGYSNGSGTYISPSPIRLHNSLDMNNSNINNAGTITMINTEIVDSAGIKGGSTGDLSITAGINSRNLILNTRNSTGSIIQRVKVNGGNKYNIQIGDGVKQFNITLTNESGGEWCCGIRGQTWTCEAGAC